MSALPCARWFSAPDQAGAAGRYAALHLRDLSGASEIRRFSEADSSRCLRDAGIACLTRCWVTEKSALDAAIAPHWLFRW